MQINLFQFFNSFELKQYTFFFPPYSLLYWHMIEKEGALMSFLNIKTYLINQLSLYSNVTIYDFQMIDEIKNLSLYKDPTHYHPDINHLMAS